MVGWKWRGCVFGTGLTLLLLSFARSLAALVTRTVGGGFPGSKSTGITFEQIASVLGPSIDEFFPSHIKVIAEPGRYFVSAAQTLAVNITARRVVAQPPTERPATPMGTNNDTESDAASTLIDGSVSGSNEYDKLRLSTRSPGRPAPAQDKAFMYYINDGTYGSFNCIYFDHVQPTPRVLSLSGSFHFGLDPSLTLAEYPCSIWGPTCDSMDCITKNGSLPEMKVGDWMYFEDMGAYTTAAGSEFNGFRKSRVQWTMSEVELYRGIVEGRVTF
jgi:ornithine decarboxylase